MAVKKIRADILLVEKGLAGTREKAHALIMAGKVLDGDTPVKKAGDKLPETAELRLRGAQSKYVSRGGDKLEGALIALEISVDGMDALDIGASTGGFTDCMLQRGASSVCALDVGHSQLAQSMRNDPRVTVIERANARNLQREDFGRSFSFITMDVSFISLLKVMPALIPLTAEGGKILALIKPQFEIGKGLVGKGGVVRDPAAHIEVMRNIIEGAEKIGLHAQAAVHSSLPGPKGNIEYFCLFTLEAPEGTRPNPEEIVAEAMRRLVREKEGK